MTLNSYRDPELRDRRSVFARYPLMTALGAVVGAFALLVPVGMLVGRADHVVVRTATLPGGVIDAMVIEPATTASVASITVATTAPATTVATTAATEPATTITTAPPTTAKPVATTRKTATTAKKKVVTTAAPKPATTAAKPKTTTTAATPKPATTAAPPKTTTTAAKPTTTTTVFAPVVYSQAQSEAVIRNVWPDDLEEKAVAIATRESNLHNAAHNYCCYGLFQINFAPHQQWLATVGVTKPEQLYDPTVNAQVAYKLYVKAGWAPWGG